MRRRAKLIDTLDAEARLEAGESFRDIARSLGISASGLHARLKRVGRLGSRKPGRSRIHESRAARQAAYRRRKETRDLFSVLDLLPRAPR
jgi:transposase-like protein